MQKLRILLLQARRADDPAKAEERESFALKLGLPEHRIFSHDLLSGPPSLQSVQSYDALMMGGSGDFYVSKRDLYGFEALLELLAEVVEVGHPTFASCFGFQSMVEALGGRIVHDVGNSEVGTYRLWLTDEGRTDDLAGTLPHVFLAQMGHKDRAQQLPEKVVNLASSERCRFQAFRIPDCPIWAFQFHPELDATENRLRFIRYLDGYATYMSREEREETLKRFVDSPETEKLLPAFLRLVFG